MSLGWDVVLELAMIDRATGERIVVGCDLEHRGDLRVDSVEDVVTHTLIPGLMDRCGHVDRALSRW